MRREVQHRLLNAQQRQCVVRQQVINVPPDSFLHKPSDGQEIAMRMGRVSQSQMAMAMAASDMGKVPQGKMAMAASEMDKVSKEKLAMAASEMGNVPQGKMAMAASKMGNMSKSTLAIIASGKEMIKGSKTQEMIIATARNASKVRNQDMFMTTRNAVSISVEREKPKTKIPQTNSKQPDQIGVITNDWDRNGTAMLHQDGFQNHLSSKSMELEEPYFLRLRKSLPWWEKHAPAATVRLIKQGVRPTFTLPDHLDSKQQKHSPQEEAQALKVLQEYMQVGAVIKDPPGLTRHLIPWFVISKQEQGNEKLG